MKNDYRVKYKHRNKKNKWIVIGVEATSKKEAILKSLLKIILEEYEFDYLRKRYENPPK